MKNLKTQIVLRFNLGVLVPTLFYFFSLWYYGFMSNAELIQSLTTPRWWMLFVIIYFPLLNLFVLRKLKIVSDYLEAPAPDKLEKVQRTVARLPRIFITHVGIYAMSGASSLVLIENYFTNNERILALVLGAAFCVVYALPFFIRAIMLVEKWAAVVPLSDKYKFMSVKTKLYYGLFCNVLGVAVVIATLNIGVIVSIAGGADSSQLFHTLLEKNLVIGLLCLAIVIINLRTLSIQLVGPIEETTQMFQVISSGDLTKKIDIASKDEIGILKFWIDTFVDKIHDVIARVREGAGHVDSSATTLVENIDTIASSMNDMTNAATQIAVSADETCRTLGDVVESVNILNSSITNIAEHSTRARTQSQKTVEVTNRGKEVVTSTITEMDDIRTEMTKLVSTIEEMGQSVIQIQRIVNLIGDVTRQTNMLAINASIEAARAGEQGRGFSVVADSISKLSEQSKESTKEISRLVEEIQKTVKHSIETTRESVGKVDSGVEMVRQTNTVFDEVYDAINSTTRLVNEIAAATDKQAAESQTIMGSVKRVNQMSLQVSALVQEQVAATEEMAATLDIINSSSNDSTSQRLANESRELYNLISQFQVAATEEE